MEYYEQNGRNDLPWRVQDDERINPYHVLVSEFMLQQTQVARVLKKYPVFLSRFPSIERLASAPQSAVIEAWQGLGYNRRALALHKSARHIAQHHHATIPSSREDLLALPGVGAATAGAIRAFAFNQPAIFIETNIRRAFIDFFFPSANQVTDKDILPLIEKTHGDTHPRVWYYALMDYGNFLSKTKKNPNRKSRHYSIQSPFEDSDRQLRAMALRMLLKRPYSYDEMVTSLDADDQRVHKILDSLQKDGFITQGRSKIALII